MKFIEAKEAAININSRFKIHGKAGIALAGKMRGTWGVRVYVLQQEDTGMLGMPEFLATTDNRSIQAFHLGLMVHMEVRDTTGLMNIDGAVPWTERLRIARETVKNMKEDTPVEGAIL